MTTLYQVGNQFIYNGFVKSLYMHVFTVIKVQRHNDHNADYELIYYDTDGKHHTLKVSHADLTNNVESETLIPLKPRV